VAAAAGPPAPGEGSRPDDVAGRLALLDALAGLARVTAESPDSATTLDGFSVAVRPLIPHDWVNVAWLEADGQRYHLLGRVVGADGQGEAPPEEGEVLTDHSPITHTLRTGEPRLMADYLRDPLWHEAAPHVRAMAARQGLRAGVAVALRLAGRIIGALVFASRQPNRYTPGHVAVAQAIADQLAPFVENLRLYAIERRQREHIEALNAIGQTIAASLEVDDVFPVFAAATRRLLDHDRTGVSVLSEDGTALERLAFASHVPTVFAFEERVPLDQTNLSLVITEDAPLWSSDLAADPRVEKALDRQAVTRQGLASLIAVPLRAKGRAFGLLSFTSLTAGCYDESHVAVAQQIADQIAPFLDNVRLYRQVRALAAAEERNRLAREVHDTLAQGLTAIALQLDTAELLLPPGAAEAIGLVAQARELTRRSLEEARRAVWGLHPTPLENRTLAEALDTEVTAFARRAGIECGYEVQGAPVALTIEYATALFRIAQEALHNVEKHARARRVRVELEFRAEPPAVVLRVADDGQGFAADSVTPSPDGGFGLPGMRERARLVGGTFEVESAAGLGTRLVASVPLAPDERQRAAADAAGAPIGAPATPRRRSAAGRAAPVRVLIVDDHQVARAGLRRLLAEESGVRVVGEAADREAALKQALALRPDVILMDLQLPRQSAVPAVRDLRARWPEARVLIVTTFAQDEHLFDALKAGARGYLLKDSSRAELVHGIQTVYAGGSLVQPVVASRLIDRFGELVRQREGRDALTDREREVLALVARGARRRAIAVQLGVDEKTVKDHLTAIYGKLGVSSRPAAVARARALGLLPHDALALA
jgi:signal transduction histidine kinase/DNA-binding NarL/FixJ family response regulator